jgi:hypothetical protein
MNEPSSAPPKVHAKAIKATVIGFTVHLFNSMEG